MVVNFTQYKNDFFSKLNFSFQKGRKILDVGCGDGTDAEILARHYKLDVFAIDVYKNENINIQDVKFQLASITNIPFRDYYFDYVFMHDVMHHIDEEGQREIAYVRGLRELRRVCKRGGSIVIVEANRYNPLFYPHMVLLKGHNHFRQSYFRRLLGRVFKQDSVSFGVFEAHFYPQKLLPLFRVYEWIMERFVPRQFLAYNVAIIKKR